MIEALTREPAAPSALLVFSAGGVVCAFPIADVQGIAAMASLWRPPGLPKVLEGFLNLRGTATPIVRFSHLFSLPQQPLGLYSSIIFLDSPQGPTGILVDSVIHIISPPPHSALPVRASQSFNHCLTAELEIDGNPIHVLCPERLLTESERASMAEFQLMAHRRQQDSLGGSL